MNEEGEDQAFQMNEDGEDEDFAIIVIWFAIAVIWFATTCVMKKMNMLCFNLEVKNLTTVANTNRSEIWNI